MEIKITKKRLIGKCGNCWCDYANFYLIYGKIYSDDGKYFKRFKFVAEINFSADGWDEEGQRDYTEKEMLENTIFSYIDCIGSFENCSEFFEICHNIKNHSYSIYLLLMYV